MKRTGGYTHGNYTLIVPEDVALPMAKLAREFGVSERELMVRAISFSVDRDYINEVLLCRPDGRPRVQNDDDGSKLSAPVTPTTP